VKTVQIGLFPNVIETLDNPILYTKHFPYKTKKITFSMHYKHKLITFEELKEFRVENREEGCLHVKPCSNYKNCWGCPPYAPLLERYNQKNYKYCLVYCFWLDWDFSIASDNPYFKLINANRTLSPYATKYGQKLEMLLGGKDMIDGRCPLCPKCYASFEPKQPCKFPTKRRSSLEAVGLDASLLSERVLEHPIQWYKKVDDKIVEPRYLTCVHGLLTDSKQPKEMVT